MAVPKEIHIVWIGDETKRPDDYIDTWRRMNPTYSVRVWGNADLVKTDWKLRRHIELWLPREINGAADLMRWEILYNHGGMALDADSYCVRPLEDWLLEPDCFAVWENEIVRPGLIACGAMGCVRNHPLIGQIMTDIAEDNDPIGGMAWEKLGPGRITQTVRSNQYTGITVYPSHYFIPRHFTGIKYSGSGAVFAAQQWGSTFQSYGKKLPAQSSDTLSLNDSSQRAADAREVSAEPDQLEVAVAQMIKDGNLDYAVMLLEAALAKGETAELWNNWATVQCARDNVIEAEKGYRQALVLDSRNRQATVNLGLLLLVQQKLEEAIPLLERCKDSLTSQEQQAIKDLIAPLVESAKGKGIHANVPNSSAVDVPDAMEQNQAKQPYCSIVIPCYKQGSYLPEAVASVVAQTFPDWELIIVNDGCPGDTSMVASQLIDLYPHHSIRLIEKVNEGLAEARNTGVRAARGRCILPLDADDRMLPQMLEKMVSVMETDPSVSIVYTDLQEFGAANRLYRNPEYNFESLCHCNQLNYASLYKREVWESVGGYNKNMVWGYEDWDFWISCGARGYVVRHIPEPLFLYRIKESSMLTNARGHDRELRAQIVLNHPGLYDQRIRLWAESILAEKQPTVCV